MMSTFRAVYSTHNLPLDEGGWEGVVLGAPMSLWPTARKGEGADPACGTIGAHP